MIRLDGLDLRYMKTTPLFKTPVMQMMSSIGTCQQHPKCAQFESMYRRCAATYGFPRNQKKCFHEYQDFMECVIEYKRHKRFLFIKEVQHAKYKRGETSVKYLPPPHHSMYDYIESSAH